MKRSTSLRGRNGRSRISRPQSAGRINLVVEHLEDRWVPALVVPALSSLPGANQTIYLDFDGHVTVGTRWNTEVFNNGAIFSPAFNTDGDPNNFSAGETAAIIEAWQRVSEDFIPFEVNVTTVDPGIEALRKTGAGDTQWGIRAIITDNTEGLVNTGGIAFLNSFTGSVDVGCFIYNKGSGALAETISHEVGHTLGLTHDGTTITPLPPPAPEYYGGHGSGETSWGPIMGAPFNRNITQWSNGDYFGSNNAQDDLKIITTQNGFGYRADDYGDSIATAGVLSSTGPTSGIITTRSDLDYLRYDSPGGTVTFTANTFRPGPNLDVQIALFDANGVMLAFSAPDNSLNASITQFLNPATPYYLVVDGGHFGNPKTAPVAPAILPTGYSDYGSIGRYTVTVTTSAASGLSINDVTVNEAAGTAVFTVTRVGPLASTISVGYATANGTAVAPGDYTAKTGVLTFNPNESSKTIEVAIVNDTFSEVSESFYVNLFNPTPGTALNDPQGVATIVDDDAPALFISDVSATEGNSGTKTFVFTVGLSRPTAAVVTVNYATADGSATLANNDYKATSGKLTFNPNQATATISVQVNSDTRYEPDEKFFVNLSGAVNASLGNTRGIGTIVNDDARVASATRVAGAPVDFLFESEVMARAANRVAAVETSSTSTTVDPSRALAFQMNGARLGLIGASRQATAANNGNSGSGAGTVSESQPVLPSSSDASVSRDKSRYSGGQSADQAGLDEAMLDALFSEQAEASPAIEDVLAAVFGQTADSATPLGSVTKR